MPPQSNRNAAGPQMNLSPVERTGQRANLRVTPANVDGPNLNNARMFEQLGKALDLGVQVTGQFHQMAKEENLNRFRADLAEADLAFSRGEKTMSDYDAFLASAGEDPVKQKLVFDSMSRAEYKAKAGTAGKYLGARMFDFEDEAVRSDILSSLPGEEPLDVELVAALEQAAKLSVPTYDALDPRDQEALVGYGVAQFKNELMLDQQRIKQEEALAVKQGQTAALNAAWFPAEDGTFDMGEVVDATYAKYGETKQGIDRAFARAASQGDLDMINSLAAEFVADGKVDNQLVAEAQQQATLVYAQNVAMTAAESVGAAMSMTPQSVPTVFGNIPNLMDGGLTSENVSGRMVDMVMEGQDLPDTPEVRATVEKTLRPQLNAAEAYLVAEEKRAENADALRRGTATQEQIDQIYTTDFSDMGLALDEVAGMSVEDVSDNFVAYGQIGAAWYEHTSVNGTTNAPLPTELKARLNSLAKGSSQERLAAVSLFQGLGGLRNPQAVSALDQKSRVMLATAGMMIGTWGAGQSAPAVMIGPGMGVDTAALDRILFAQDEMTQVSETDTAAFQTAFTELSNEMYGTDGWLPFDATDADAGVMSALPAEVQLGLTELALESSVDPAQQAATMHAMIADLGYLPVHRSEDSPSTLMFDPRRRITEDMSKDMAGWAKSLALGDMYEKVAGALPTDVGLRTAIENGDIEIELNTDFSLGPNQDAAIFNVNVQGGDGTMISLPWEQVVQMEAAMALAAREEKEAAQARQEAERIDVQAESFTTPAPQRNRPTGGTNPKSGYTGPVASGAAPARP